MGESVGESVGEMVVGATVGEAVVGDSVGEFEAVVALPHPTGQLLGRILRVVGDEVAVGGGDIGRVRGKEAGALSPGGPSAAVTRGETPPAAAKT